MAFNTLPLFADSGKFYVYIYRDPRPRKKKCPVYVGKGTAKNRRADAHRYASRSKNPIFFNVLSAIKRSGLKPIVEIVGWYDNEALALVMEKKLINRFGRKDMGTGSLCNCSDGGESPTGVSEETRQRMSDAAKRRPNNFLGRKHSDETKARMSEQRKGRLHTEAWKSAMSARMMENNPFKGCKHTQEVRALISDMNRKRDLSRFTTKGMTHSPEARAKISAALKGRKLSEETKTKISIARRKSP